MQSASKNVQDLVDCFDEIPDMMSKIKSSQQNRSRFQILEPNHSYSVSQVLRGNRALDTSNPGNSSQVSRMVSQAKKVLNHLNQIPRNKSANDVESLAKLAEDRLRKLKDSGVDLSKFYRQYDVHRNGKVSYKDFSDILLSVSSGISREDAMQLAARIDRTKAGVIDYKNILTSLHQVASQKASSQKSDRSNIVQPPSTNVVRDEEPTQDDQFAVPVHDITLTRPPQAAYDPTAHYIPKDVYTLQALSPTDYEKKKGNIFSADESVVERASRRFYHDRPSTQVTAQLKARIPPFFVDPSSYEQKPRKRASSEPPKSSRSLSQQLSKASNGNDEHEQFQMKSLRSSLLKDPSSHPQVSSPLHKEKEDVIHPLKQMINSTAEKKEQSYQLKAKFAENTIIQQLKGNTSVLRHLLKQQDQSRSGYVNHDEFKKALLKIGVTLDNRSVDTLFDRYASSMDTATSQDAGLSKGKAVRIESFVDQIHTRTTAPAFAHVIGEQRLIKQSQDSEKIRVMRKVMHSISKLSSPQQLFNDISGKNTNIINIPQLRDSLQYAGACLSDSEFRTLVSEMDTNHDGRISLNEFDTFVNRAVMSFEKEKHDALQEQLNKYPHYSKTFKTTGIFMEEVEFQRLDQTRLHRKDKRLWGKLKEHLRANHDKVLKAFAKSEEELKIDRSPPKLSLQTICRNLSKEGVLLGQQDLELMQEQILGSNRDQSEAIPMDQFFDATGIPLAITRDKDTYVSLDRNAVISDEGVFASSRRSISANPKFSTSVFLQGDDVTHKQQFGERKRRMSLGDHMRSSSEFWEMRRSVDNPMLFPVAVGNSHPSFSNSLDHSMALRGVIQLKSTPHSRSSRTLSRTGLGSDVDDLRSQSQTTVSGDHRRSHSAPPSSRSLAHYHTPMTTTPPKYFKEERGGNSRPSSKVISPISPQPRTEVNRVNTASMGEKISKWSTPTLGDYFKEKEHGKNVQRPRSDSRESTVSPASYHSSSTNSIGTADRYGRGPTKFFNTADQARGSLRKQVGQSHSIAPYGTDR